MAHSKSKITMEEIPGFRKFLEARGFKCRDGKGQWQLFQIQSVTGHGWKPFCHNAKGVVNSPAEFDMMIQVFKAPVDPAQVTGSLEITASHDSDLLDDFAIAAMPAVLALLTRDPERDQKGLHLEVANRSYGIAKAMMAERAKHQPK